jgi:hypothetical protein
MKRHTPRFRPVRSATTALIACVPLLFCGLTVFAAETEPEITQPPSPSVATVSMPPPQEDDSGELYPADVQTVYDDGKRQIIKTYILTAEQNPKEIPRENFERDGFRYVLTDITENKTSGTDVKIHTETVEIATNSKDLNAILEYLAPTLEYQSEDGYGGTLKLDLASVTCGAAGYKNSSYTVSVTREYPHLSSNDTSLIPKTVAENGKTLMLTGVTWEAQHTVNVDYANVPESYRAIAKYTGSVSKNVATGYITTAEYTGEITKTIMGEAVYTAYFSGSEINPSAPSPTRTPPSVAEPDILALGGHPIPFAPLMAAIAGFAALIGGLGAFFFLRRNVKVYAIGNDSRILTAKVRISANNPVIDLSPLESHVENRRFELEIERITAKRLNGKTVEVIFGPMRLKHKIAYEGNVYRIDTNFHTGTVQALY